MRYIDRITDDARQQLLLNGNEGQIITLSLRFMPSQRIWVMDVVEGAFSLYGVNVVASPNLLQNYSNLIRFGFTCTTENGVDPYRITDFLDGTAKLFLMAPDDVLEVEGALYSG